MKREHPSQLLPRPVDPWAQSPAGARRRIPHRGNVRRQDYPPEPWWLVAGKTVGLTLTALGCASAARILIHHWLQVRR